jgi:hypothetical protein
MDYPKHGVQMKRSTPQASRMALAPLVRLNITRSCNIKTLPVKELEVIQVPRNSKAKRRLFGQTPPSFFRSDGVGCDTQIVMSG